MYWIVCSVTKLWKILAKFFCKYIHIYVQYVQGLYNLPRWLKSFYLRSACKVRWLIHKPYPDFTIDKPHGVLEHQGRWRASLCTRTEPLACSPSLPVAVKLSTVSEIKHCDPYKGDAICNVCAMVWKSYWIYLLVSQFYGSRKSSEIGGSSYRCDICSNLFLQSTEYIYFTVLKWFAWLHVHVIISRYSLPWIKIIHV